MNKLVFASVISEIQQSDIFMTVKARICEAPAANLNGARVTEAFIDEIVDNPDRYVGLPLYADVRALTNGNYRRLGHLYDSKTGEFHSTQIGSFYQFEKETFETDSPEGKVNGCYLVGYARIAKRNKKLSKAISELFTDGALKFSFEVAVGEYEELDDDTILIDASDSNYLEGTAIVTFPACEEAVALELVAQQKADDTEGGEMEMADTKIAENIVEEKTTAENAENEAEKNAQATVAENAPENAPAEAVAEAPAQEIDVTAETTAEESGSENTEEGNVQTKTAEQENAAVVIHETHREQQSTYAYDTESGVDVSQVVSVETSVSHVEPEASIVEADDGIRIAEDDKPVETAEAPDDGDGGDTPSDPVDSGESGDTPTDPVQDEGNDPEPAAEDPVLPGENKKKTAEQLIAELTEVVASLKVEVEELKAQKVIAEKKPVTAEVNPFIDPIQSTGKYSLLEKEDRQFTSYTLL